MEKENKILTGSLYRGIFFLSLPLIASNLLQVLFNLSDIAVVGKFAGATALGSVGSCTTLVTLFTGLAIGMGNGINAITARYIGENNKNNISKTVHTALILSVLYGLIVMILGFIIVRPILILLSTKAELLPGANLYMMIYLCGTPALCIYNCGNGILSAGGDTKRPLYYLTCAGILNIALNLIFVIAFHMGVAGVALASAISQWLSAFLIIRRLFCCDEDYKISADKLKIDKNIAIKILSLGVPTGLQNSIFAIANLFIQSAVNSFDTVMVEGNSAAANSDALFYDVMSAFYVAGATYIAQNFGAGNKKRIIKSYVIMLSYAFAIAFVGGLLLFFFGDKFLYLFTSEHEVVVKGMERLSIMAFSYCISAFMDATIAAVRGLGETIIPTIIVILGSCVFRIAWIYTVFAYFGTIASLYLLYPFSWIITAIFEFAYFIKVYRKMYSKLLF